MFFHTLCKCLVTVIKKNNMFKKRFKELSQYRYDKKIFKLDLKQTEMHNVNSGASNI